MQVYLVCWWTKAADGISITDCSTAHIASTLALAEEWIRTNRDWPDLEDGDGLWFVEEFLIDESQCDRRDGPDYYYYTLEGEPSDTRGRPLKQLKEKETESLDTYRPLADKLTDKIHEMRDLMAELIVELRNL